MSRKYKPLVYVCSPYSGNIKKNTSKARVYSRFVVEKECIPFTPHLLFPQFLSEKYERELAMKMNFVFIGKCDELWVFGNVITAGMRKEINKATRMKKTIRYFDEM